MHLGGCFGFRCARAHTDRTRGRGFEPGQDVEDRALAAAARPDHRHEFARIGAEGHRIEHETRFSGRVEPLGQVLDFDHCILDHRVSHVRDLSFIAHGATMRSMANVSKYSVTLINAVTSTAANTRSVRKEFFWVLM